ncbi:DUF4321 domain-containing protein [Caldisericum exile]|uniref:DUF4321 domain-containing protein n=1 Tax=Caldisericum exile (strain DSM 21853 / NBRC 104410 / AZM16c01) TaxID=511051 RepID=A0A7U6JF43_CALEA|nr:DUF4321 domain-containing protein [Caldisericum exile]BAL81078.1 hypothetical protein CSE_09520 [Caldisericum exile AZM16c01]
MKKFSYGRFFIFVILGLIIGTPLGVFIGKVFPVFDYGLNFGFPTMSLDFVFIKLTFGVSIKINVGSIIGVILFVLFFTLT